MSQEYVIGLVVTIVLGIIGSLLSRSISSLDSKLDTTCNAVEAMKLEMKGYETLTQYLKADVESLKNENGSLRKSVNEMDKWIFALGQRTGHPTPPPPTQ
jgi:uncharacterized protein YoxC